MATAAPAASAEAHQASQEALAALAAPLLDRAWALLDLNNLEGTLPMFLDAVQAVVDHFGSAAAAVAIQHYKAVRSDSGVPGRVSVTPAAPTEPGFVDQLVVESVALAEQDAAAGLDNLDAGAEQLVLEQGRRQMMSAVALDDAAKGWHRIPNAGACSFCLMLALNVYKSKRSASFLAHRRKPNGSGGDCRCTPEPDFGNYERTARVREAQNLWDEVVTKEGRTGEDARTAFRQAVEGRNVTGAKKKPARKALRKGEGKTPENQRAQLRVLEAMPPAKTPEAAQWRRNRLAEIRKYLGE